jgi:isoleucyl-tRNA synthetase
MIIRYNVLKGKKVYYKPGWDCHGLPIELKALEKYKKLHKDEALDVKKVRQIAKKHALTTIDSQLNKFKELAILTDFTHIYRTLNHDFEIAQLETFHKMMQNGLIKRQKKPVYWGCETMTALAESELEYNENHRSRAIYVKFPLIDRLKDVPNDLPVHLLIWTSTPWTIPSNRAICINEQFEYTILSSYKDNLIISKELAPKILKLSPEYKQIPVTIPGASLIGLSYKNPKIDGSKFPVLHGDHVTNSAGTGMVHTAPGHGNDDYFVCLQNDIEPYSPVDQQGRYTDELPQGFQELQGMKVLQEGTKRILGIMNDAGMILATEDYSHSYPYDWRSKKPVIIRATPQWFANVGAIKSKALNAIQSVRFVPENGKNRLSAFITNRNEWCISRQRSWGVPIPALYSKRDENVVLMDDESVKHIIKKIDELGIDSWFEEEDNVERWLPESHRGQGVDFYKGKDTMDVWFDSGSSWNEIVKFCEENNIKRDILADVYLEGSDQHRGWFQSSILTKVGTSNEAKAPYRTIVTHGFTLDEKSNKMSKSLGNTLAPDHVIHGGGKGSNKVTGIGVDGLRLWVAQADYTTDMSIGPIVLKHSGDALKKLRLTFSFLLGNLEGFEHAKLVPYDQLQKIDQYALCKLYSMQDEVLALYEEYNFSRAFKVFANHLNVEASAIYFDAVKDRLYADSTWSLSRLSAQTVLTEFLKVYSTLLSPLLPLITQEAWDFAPTWLKDNEPHPLTYGIVKYGEQMKDQEMENDFAKIFKIKDEVLLLQEHGRKNEKTIKNSLESSVYLTVEPTTDINETLGRLQNELAEVFRVSSVHINESIPCKDYQYDGEVTINGTTIKVSVLPSNGAKCPRCWNFTSVEESLLCHRCENVLKELE